MTIEIPMGPDKAQEREIALYIMGLPKREERAYAAAFAHWLVVTLGDHERAAAESLDRATGIRAARLARIQRDLIQRGVC
jgi:hypothetical protein